jgi:2-amino-4-hydroxy-6-hydroxymethyldihydropteridine diphosphokinase
VIEAIHQVYLALGSNLGDRLHNLHSALEHLPPEVRLTAVSPVFETDPWGVRNQPRFLNQACAGVTTLPPLALLDHLKAIEVRLGRLPTFRFGPRLIDLDVLFYDDLMMESARLVIPHPRLHQRAFVLVPLAHIAPQLRHPRLGKTVSEMLAELPQTGINLYEPG